MVEFFFGVFVWWVGGSWCRSCFRCVVLGMRAFYMVVIAETREDVEIVLGCCDDLVNLGTNVCLCLKFLV